MITMKKKVLVAMAMAAAMVAMPVVAGAAVSPSQSESDGTIGNDSSSSSSSSSSSNNTVSNSGNTENQNTPGVASGATKEAEKTVVQGANNERVEVVGTTKDSKGTTVGLVGNDAGKGSVSSDNGASVSIATGDAEVAVAYYDNNTGLWVVVKNVTFNASAKTVSFAVPGSCTVQVVAK